MPSSPAAQPPAAKLAAALILTLCSGIVDIVGYLGIFRLFTAQMTGTTVELAHSLVNGNFSNASLAAIVVASFFAGSVAGRILIELGARAHLRRIATLTLGIEAVLIAAVAYVAGGASSSGTTAGSAPSTTITACIAALAVAMGLQTATLTRVGPLTVHTTFLTGMINKLAQVISRILFDAYDVSRSGNAAENDVRRAQLAQNGGQAVFLTAIWIFYLAGAAAGVWMFSQVGLRALNVSAALLLAVIVVDQFSALSVEEEIEQSER